MCGSTISGPAFTVITVYYASIPNETVTLVNPYNVIAKHSRLCSYCSNQINFIPFNKYQL
jgi:hypothetical protein